MLNIYKMVHIRFIILMCVCIFILVVGLDAVLDAGLESDHFAELTSRTLLLVVEYYM